MKLYKIRQYVGEKQKNGKRKQEEKFVVHASPLTMLPNLVVTAEDGTVYKECFAVEYIGEVPDANGVVK
jgi:hypothetical protein